MIVKYVLLAWRKCVRNPLFSAINIIGLTLGLVSFLIISLYTWTQYTYDTHHNAADNLYRVETVMESAEGPWESATVSPPIVPAMETDFPEIIQSARVVDPPETSHHILRWNDNAFYETKGYYVDSSFFKLFKYDWVEGDPGLALQAPYTVVLTKKVKDKLFGSQAAALGEMIQIENRFGTNAFMVNGVVDASTFRSHLRPHFYMAMNSGGIGEYVRQNNQWAGGNFIYGYVRLGPGTNRESLLKKLPAFLLKHGAEQFENFGYKKILSLQAVRDIHTRSSRDNQIDTTSHVSFLIILILIATFILIIACVNFMNLSTARSLQNGLEVGIRKTIGAGRTDIAKQYFLQSFVVTGFAFVMAAILTSLLLPVVSNYVGDAITWKSAGAVRLAGGILLLYVATASIAGSYPALFLSSFKPVSTIKGIQVNRHFQGNIRKGLVIFQFTISLCLIIGALIMFQQVRFMQDKDPGFERENKLIVPFRTDEARQKLAAFKTRTLAMPGVVSAAGARIYPGQFMPQDFNLYTEGKSMENSHNVNLVQGDEDYLTTLKIPLLNGRSFSAGDTSLQILINQTALANLGVPESEAIGTPLFAEFGDERSRYEIIGVVRDYHQGSLKDAIQPIIFEYRPTGRNLALIIDGGAARPADLTSGLATLWNQLIPGVPFDFTYLDDRLEAQYNQESRLSALISSFTGIAIFISCLGLFGLAAFMTEQRKKEIGIRKVLGAEIPGLVLLLSLDFLKLVSLAILVASPLAAYFMSQWLDGFAYHITLSWVVFVSAGVLALSVAFLTVSAQSIKTAFSHPAQSLRNT